MATTLKLRRGTTAQHSTFTGEEGEVTVDMTKDTVVVHDGATAGGFPLAKESALADKLNLSGGTITGNLAVNGNTTLGDASGDSLTVNGATVNLPASGTRITGDFSNATVANRLMFQSSTTDGNTTVSVIPNGTASAGAVAAYNNSTPTNASVAQLVATSTEVQVRSEVTGSGTALPMTFYTNGSERLRVGTSGQLGVNGTNYGTTGQILTSQGASAAPVWAAAPAGGFSEMQVFTSSGTFTVPAGVTKVKVTVVGGGGAGGSANTSTSAAVGGGGGGGGGASIEVISGLTPSDTVTVTVGGAGGTSSFGSYCSATGGSAGGAGGTIGGAGGAGGVGSGGDLNISGSGGTSAPPPASAITSSGAGGSSILGGGGRGLTTSSGNTTGIAGGAYGGGGGGGIESGSGSASGGAGASGVVIVEY